MFSFQKCLTKNLVLNKFLYSTIRTHYEVLNISPSSTQKEIKEAFFILSKEHHPDINQSKNSHKVYLKILEAYKILGNDLSRKEYDISLSAKHFKPQQTVYYGDEILYTNKPNGIIYEKGPYYGIKGVNKQSNFRIVLFCLFVTCFGTILQFIVVKKSFDSHREVAEKKSQENAELLKQAREFANLNGNELQLEKLRASAERYNLQFKSKVV